MTANVSTEKTQTPSRLDCETVADGGITFSGFRFGRSPKIGWWVMDIDYVKVPKPNLWACIDALAEAFSTRCANCGAYLRRVEGGGVCSDCHESRCLTDFDSPPECHRCHKPLPDPDERVYSPNNNDVCWCVTCGDWEAARAEAAEQSRLDDLDPDDDTQHCEAAREAAGEAHD